MVLLQSELDYREWWLSLCKQYPLFCIKVNTFRKIYCVTQKDHFCWHCNVFFIQLSHFKTANHSFCSQLVCEIVLITFLLYQFLCTLIKRYAFEVLIRTIQIYKKENFNQIDPYVIYFSDKFVCYILALYWNFINLYFKADR